MPKVAAAPGPASPEGTRPRAVPCAAPDGVPVGVGSDGWHLIRRGCTRPRGRAPPTSSYGFVPAVGSHGVGRMRPRRGREGTYLELQLRGGGGAPWGAVHETPPGLRATPHSFLPRPFNSTQRKPIQVKSTKQPWQTIELSGNMVCLWFYSNTSQFKSSPVLPSADQVQSIQARSSSADPPAHAGRAPPRRAPPWGHWGRLSTHTGDWPGPARWGSHRWGPAEGVPKEGVAKRGPHGGSGRAQGIEPVRGRDADRRCGKQREAHYHGGRLPHSVVPRRRCRAASPPAWQSSPQPAHGSGVSRRAALRPACLRSGCTVGREPLVLQTVRACPSSTRSSLPVDLRTSSSWRHRSYASQ